MAPSAAYYEHFSHAELAADEYFRQYVLFPDVETVMFWEAFIDAYPQQEPELQIARSIVEAEDTYPWSSLSHEEKSALKFRIEEQVKTLPAGGKSSFTQWRHLSRPLMVAASIVVFVLILFYQRPEPAVQDMVMVEVVATDTMKKIPLPDGSMVTLNANSSIRYARDFLDRPLREIHLTGNGFFDVKKIEGKPFVVQAGSVLIEVLGTRFNVDSRSKATGIVLTSGRLNALKTHDPQTNVYLNPGEKLWLDTIKGNFVKTPVDTSMYAPWTEGNWRFRQTSLEDITRLIESYYGVEVVFANPKSRRLRISAIFPVDDLQSLLDVIAETLAIKISHTRNQIIVQ